jgi:DNA-binding MarR family transcriptional regulator
VPPRSIRSKSRPSRSDEVTAGLEQHQYEALAEFRQALRSFLAFSEAAAREFGVTTQHYQALLVLKADRRGAVLVRDLAQSMLLKHNNAVQLVDRLVRAGLVRREPSTRDKRAVELRLTAKGEKTIAHLAPLHFRELAKRQAQMTDISRLARQIDSNGEG